MIPSKANHHTPTSVGQILKHRVEVLLAFLLELLVGLLEELLDALHGVRLLLRARGIGAHLRAAAAATGADDLTVNPGRLANTLVSANSAVLPLLLVLSITLTARCT